MSPSNSKTGNINQPDWPVILASGSPRRKEILEKWGLEFRVITSGTDEIESGSPEDVAIKNSWLKATEVAKDNREYIVIGSDTVVTLGGKLFGKPQNSNHAFEMLSELNGTCHQVISGVAVVGMEAGIEYVFADSTDVQMRKNSIEDIQEYIRRAQPFDKAGAYGIQDSNQNLIESIDGSYENVMGFPIEMFEKKWNHYVIN